MSLTKFNQDVNNHQSLPDKPAMTAQQLKILFDKAGVDIKAYINEVLTEEIDTLIATATTNVNSKVSKSGDTMTGNLNMGSNKIIYGGAEITSLATKNYSYGTSAPSGGSNGDIYDQYFN